MLVLFVNVGFGFVWYYLRLFVIVLGINLLLYVLDLLFFSDYLIVLWIVVFSLMGNVCLCGVGVLLVLLGLLMVWVCIYLGVYYLFDMLGVVVVLVLSVWLCSGCVVYILLELLYCLGLVLYGVVLVLCVWCGWVCK